MRVATLLAAFACAPILVCAPGLAAAQSGTLHFYNWSDYIGPDAIAGFEKETGIKVVQDVYDANETLEAKLLAGSSGYDLVVPTSTYLQRQIAAGVYQPLDKSKLPNLVHLDPALMEAASKSDPGNAHAVIYLWGTNGLAYNPAKLAERLGPDFKVTSWSTIFDPDVVSKLADCGVTMLDSATEMVPLALNHLGLRPDSAKPADLEKAEALLMAVRPYVRSFNSSQYLNDLANGEICLAVAFSGDAFIAADRAAAAGNGVEVEYAIPDEGGMVWFDMLAIPADAPNPDAAHAFINYLMQPDVIAAITDYVSYPNANKDATDLVDEEIRENPSIYPTPEVLARLFPEPVPDARASRDLTRLWTKIRTGQ